MLEVKYTLDANAIAPRYAYAGDAGMDLATLDDVILDPGERIDIPTGVAIELPEGYYARLVGRSSTLRKRGLFVFEGIIDQGYRGPLFIYCENRTSWRTKVPGGTRIAQLIVTPIVQPVLTPVEQLNDSDRGANGFGSSGS